MADTVSGFTVTLATDISEEHAEEIKRALCLFEGVIDVSPIVFDPMSRIAEMRVKHELFRKIFDILKG